MQAGCRDEQYDIDYRMRGWGLGFGRGRPGLVNSCSKKGAHDDCLMEAERCLLVAGADVSEFHLL